MKFSHLVGCALIVAVAGDARADELSPEEAAIQFHGFASQGALYTTDNNYLTSTERGSLEFAEAGILLTKQVDDRLRVGFQLFARKLGDNGNFSAKFDWFGLDYRWRDWLGLRLGRNKLPFGLFNDTVDIDAAQPVVFLPHAIYAPTNRDIFLAQTGVELYGFKSLGAAGGLDYRAYFGKIYVPIPETTPGVDIKEFELPYITGARVLWETPIDGLRLGPSVLRGRIDTIFTYAGQPTQSIRVGATDWAGSIEYQQGRIWLAAEVIRGYARNLRPVRTKVGISEGGYAMASYRWSRWLQTTMYYSLEYPNIENRIGRESHTYDGAFALRFDITPHWLLKLEGHAMRGTSALTADLNDDIAPSGLANKWYLFAAKTTVAF